ncbi:MAG: hypothetical protein IPM38_06145 [Ignavibacteria bacterium]|nr:hypothetical protein [Ignavibacteria bacterium]
MMKLFMTSFIFLIILFNASSIFPQVKDCDISYLDSNHVRKSFYKIQLEQLRSDKLIFSESGNIHKVSLLNLKRIGYISDSRSPKGMLIGAGIGAGLVITLGILQSGDKGGHPDFSLNFGQVVAGTLVMAVIGGIIGGAIGGISNEKEYVSIDLSNSDLKKSRDIINQLFKKYNAGDD